jgi:transposase
MDHLDEITVEELQQAIDFVEGKKPAQRFLAAIAYKNGVTPTDLADWYGVSRRTIYRWLNRFEDRPLAVAVTDAHRSGRPRKLTEDKQNKLENYLHDSPTDAGYDAPVWTSVLVREFMREHFDVDYSIPSCRRLMKEAGLSYQELPRRAAEADPADRDDFHDEFKKVAEAGCHSSLHRSDPEVRPD